MVEQALALPEAERGKALDKAMARFARQVSAEDAEWLLELRKHGKPGIADEQWKQFLTRWTGAEPEKVADFLDGHGLLAGSDASWLLEAWGRGKAASVLDWVASGDDKRKQWWMTHCHILAFSWAAHDLDGALSWMDNGTGDQMEYSILAALDQHRGSKGMSAWLEAHGDQAATVSSTARIAAVSYIIQHTLKTDGPEAAAQWVAQRTRYEEWNNGLVAVRAAFTAAAPEKALTWLEGLAARQGFPRQEAEAAMAQWVATDSGAAGDWLNAHRSSPAFKEYVWAYAMNLAVENPDAARQWAALLPAEASPTVQTVNGIAWQKVDPFAGGIPGQSFGTLAQHIDAAAGLLSARNQPATASPPVVAQNFFRPRYNAVLVRESPGTEPTVRMVPRSGYG